MARDSSPSIDADDLAATLLASAQTDEPSQAAYAKAAAALGVSIAPAAVASIAPAAAAAHAASRLTLPAALKGAGLIVASGLLIGGALLYRSHQDAAVLSAQLAHDRSVARAALGARAVEALPAVPAPATVVSGAPGTPGTDAAHAPVAAEAAAAAARAESDAPAEAAVAAAPPTPPADPVSMRLRPASAARIIAAPAVAQDPPKPAVVSSLSEQVMALDRVRVALSAHRPSDALREIASYRSHYPKGVFLIEASVLEIEALAESGERKLAAARAKAFLEAHPDSPHASRLRALVR